MDIPTNTESSTEIQSRKWSASRIISAIILLILILVGIGFAVYQLTGNGPKGKTTATTYGSNHLVSPSPGKNGQGGGAKGQSANGSSSSQSSHPTTNSATGGTKTSSGSTSTSQTGTKQLSNTGPGDTALIGFTIAVIIGTFFHYRWRRVRGTNA